jgi:hypothetical protein
VTPPGATAATVPLHTDTNLPGLLGGVLDLTVPGAIPVGLGDWTLAWDKAAFDATSPTDLMILADYQP